MKNISLTNNSQITDVIDIHTHYGPWKTSDIVKYQFQGPFQNYFNLAKEVGIKNTVIFKTVDCDNKSVLNYVNANSNSLSFSYWVDVDNSKIQNELELYESDIVALKFHPTFEKTRVTDKKLIPIWNWAQDRNIPLLVHCGQWQEFSGYKIPIELAKQFDFPIVLFHMAGGGNSATQGEAIDYIHDNNIPKNIYIETSSCFQPWLIERAVEALNDDHIVFGSDFPSQDPRMALYCILQSNLSNHIKTKILRENAKRILKI